MPLMPAPAMQPPPGGQVPPEAAAPPPEDTGPIIPSRGPARDEGVMDEQQLEQFLDKSFQVIYGGQTPNGQVNPAVADQLRRNDDPTQALADTAARVASRIVSGAQESNFSLDPAVVFSGLMELVGELATIAGTEGIYDYDQGEINAAATRAGESLYGMVQGTGLISQEEMMADAGAIVEASQTGEMDQALTDLERGATGNVGAGLVGGAQ